LAESAELQSIRRKLNKMGSPCGQCSHIQGAADLNEGGGVLGGANVCCDAAGMCFIQVPLGKCGNFEQKAA